jgi:hypothetical protein
MKTETQHRQDAPALPSHRDDRDIARNAVHVLHWLIRLPAIEVKIRVEGGWVTLTGQVDWEYQRRAAADAMRDLMGVTGVSDHVAVKPRAAPGANVAGGTSRLD